MEKGRYHLVGVAGVGMSALAQALAGAGCEVTGSDRYLDRGENLDILRRLRIIGICLLPQDGCGVRAGLRGIVVSGAIEADNPDVAAARGLGIPVLHRAEALALLTADHPTIAVTGTCGKSTVTGMIGWILECAGANPTVVNGAPVLNWRDADRIGNVRLGGGCALPDAPWVVEADESDRSLLHLRPAWAVITNASKDHFDIGETRRLFDVFAARATRGVFDFACGHDAPDDLVVEELPTGCVFRIEGVEFRIGLPGRHNAGNAWIAAHVCRGLGVGLAAAAAALARFRGIERRLERVGEAGGVTVVDDYAHNPAKIRAAWGALARHFPRIVAVWRPHGFGPLRNMLPDLAETFRDVMRKGDRLFLLPVYDAGGTAVRDVQSGLLRERIGYAGAGVETVANLDAALAAVARCVGPGDAALIMGARDPGLPELGRRLVADLARVG